MTDKTLQSEIEALARYLRTRNLDAEQAAALGAATTGGIIGRNRSIGAIDDDTAEQMLQLAFEQMRLLVFGGEEHRN